MTHDEMIAVIAAHRDGKYIEFRLIGGDKRWECEATPVWDFYRLEYRIKPDPREWWIVPTSGPALFKQYPFWAKDAGHEVIQVREVLEDE